MCRSYCHRITLFVIAAVTMSLYAVTFSRPIQAQEWHHATSLFGAPKYKAGFAHFDYVNRHAPKRGQVRLAGMGSFDSLNAISFKGSTAGLLGLIYDRLMVDSLDEPSSQYGLLAEAIRYPEDYSWVSYRLRPQARWHDGTPISPEDVVFSLEAHKRAHPFYAGYYKNIVAAEITGPYEVTFRFDQSGNRELPHITGQLTILPKHWWEGLDSNGDQRDITRSTLEIPLGSGPYRIKEVSPGRNIRFERVADYWGKDLPVNVGTHNFNQLTLEYFRDDTILFEAFKSDQYDWRNENSAKRWAKEYDFPAVRNGQVIVETFTDKNVQGMQAFAINVRRAKFSDPRVREALALAFDFEWTNTNLFYDQYTRTQSFFDNSELAAQGLPQTDELALLDPLRGKIPEQVFTEAFVAPRNAQRADLRANLRQAAKLLKAAGWQIKEGILVDADGNSMTIEFLLVQPTFERVLLPYAKNLERLGVASSIRIVDSSQYQNRLDNFDFDIVIASWPQSLSPGNEQRDMWGSTAADRPGSRNLIGIKNPAIDYLVEKLIYAKNRPELVAATRALDRVLLWHHYVIPQWHLTIDRTARWDRFDRPDHLPDFSTGFPTIWWARKTE